MPPSVRLFAPRFTVEPATPEIAPVDCGDAAPLRSSVAPDVVRLTGLLDDKLPLPPIASVPLLIVVAPVYVLVPVSVSVPVPDSVNPPVPPITPAYVPLPEPPSVSVLPPRFTFVPASPDSAPVVCGEVAALRSSAAPVPARSIALPDDRLPPAPTASVLPPPIVVLPV
ncbi:conserved hypothetical protein [Burkholderia ambifaria IOP40-10]|uniref:Uncharacterized protein n=1 Tax=Burkholderia ambifaria IOP40-10 TaxID=396596 RepID=B1FRS3_9BURK|nr:conserved hypothetical protein [Burkholderia ambifaria IOP40-10]